MIVVPDIHGYTQVIDEILKKFPEEKFVFLGDFIDRGPDSAGVIRQVKRLFDIGQAQFCFGNHEAMAFDFFFNGARVYGNSLFLNGFFDTMKSYPSLEAMYEDMYWLRMNGQDYILHNGVLLCHALPPVLDEHGIVVGDTHIWGRPFTDTTPPLPENTRYSIHGHTPMAKPTRVGDNLFIDLGVYSRNQQFSKTFAVVDVDEDVLWVYTNGTWTHEHI